jgi:hypothetical protein
VLACVAWGVEREATWRGARLADRLQIETSLKSFQNAIFVELDEFGVQIADFRNAIYERSVFVIIIINYYLSIFFIFAGILQKSSRAGVFGKSQAGDEDE